MRVVKRSKIHIAPDRQRQFFDPQALQELADSIEKNTLMHPPVVRVRADGDYDLVAGERRLRAIEQNWQMGGTLRCDGREIAEGNIPVQSLGEISEEAAAEAELEENIKRQDLTWQERAAAIGRLHELRKGQRELEAGPDQLISPQTFADTALEVHGRSDGWFQDSVRQDVIVAANLDNPAIAGASTAKEAFKILKKQEEMRRVEALGIEVGMTFGAGSHSVQQGDCLEWMRACLEEPDGARFDVILTDPPYGMGADQFADGGGKLTGIEHHYKDDWESWKNLMVPWCHLAFAITKSEAHAYVFCDVENFAMLKTMMQEAGWYVFRTPLIVYKINSGRVPLPEHGPRRQYETILYAIKGKKRVNYIGSDVIESRADENLSHGAQKPVGLFAELLRRSCKPGDTVLDTFAGTGTIIRAAHALRVAGTAIELNPEYYGLCVQSLQQLRQEDEA